MFDDRDGVGVWWRKGATTIVVSYATYSAEFHLEVATEIDGNTRKLDLYQILTKNGVTLPVHRPRDIDKIDADMAEHAALFHRYAVPALQSNLEHFWTTEP